MQRLATGIKGFDDLIDGGIPKGYSVLLTGPIGSHVNLFAIEFLYRGALNGERTIFASFEKDEEEIIQMGSVFDWKIKELMKSKNIIGHRSELFNFDKFVSGLEDAIYSYKADRLVLDSVSFLGQFFDSAFKLRTGMNELIKMLEKQKCTTLMIAETHGDDLSSFGVEEFVTDGVIQLHLIKSKRELVHAISVRQMNSTKFSSRLRPFDLGKDGLEVHKIPLVI